jgi:RNA polymerase sigma factor (sigma-70 family)
LSSRAFAGAFIGLRRWAVPILRGLALIACSGGDRAVGIGEHGAVRRQLRTLFNVGAARELTDGQLLERFATDRGEAAELAFAVLVERHGPMVMRVCRGVLGDAHAAQDAFQATFLVLVRRARGLWVRDSIGPWLHQVAYRTATCARAVAARHRRLERRAAVAVEAAGADRDFELERLLHEELDRLPDRYRSPVVLCDLEGRSYEQAARSLGWPVGTVKSRLSRGRERLRNRLVRRGVAGEAGPLAVAGVFKMPAVSIPPALLDATTSAAARFAAVGPAVRGPAVLLAEGVLKTMTMSQWWKVVTILVVAGATASGAGRIGTGGALVPQEPPARNAAPLGVEDAATTTVRRGKLELAVTSRGIVEAGKAATLHSIVQGGTTITKIVPEGRRVRKGEVVAELDSSTLRDQLINQRITAGAAESQYLNAKLTREITEIAMKEYNEGTFRLELQELERAIEGSRAAIRKIEERLERTRKAGRRLQDLRKAGRGSESATEIIAELDLQDRIDEAELSRDRERRDMAQAEGRRDVLVNYTRPKTVKVLESDVKKATSDELASQATWELEKIKVQMLEQQVAGCTLVAPIEGVVIYANDPTRPPGRGTVAIEMGSKVRERQRIADIVDVGSPMSINLKVPEAYIDKITPRMRARVKVDAFSDVVLEGVVAEVAPLPDAGNFFSQSIKVYSTRIRLDRKFDGLRPGMSAEGRVIVGERDDAIGLPQTAFVPRGDGARVAVKRPDGGIEWRDVVPGASGDQVVEVKEGLRDGDRVILDPTPYLGDERKARMNPPTRPARSKAGARRKDGGQPAPPR